MTLAGKNLELTSTDEDLPLDGYVPTYFKLADAPTRQIRHQLEWCIDPPYFRRLDKKWGPHQVDPFAQQ
jgi:hypothetical protein